MPGPPDEIGRRPRRARPRRFFSPTTSTLESRALLAVATTIDLAAGVVRQVDGPSMEVRAAVNGSGPRIWNTTLQARTAQLFVTYLVGDTPLDRASATDPANYRLTLPRRSTHQDLSVSVVSVSESTPGRLGATQTVLLLIGDGRRLLHGAYQLTIRSGGVRDVAGRALDGEFLRNFGLPSGDGQPGGDFVAVTPTNSMVAFRPAPPRAFRFFGFAPEPRH